jgi:hypothetical protein
MFDIDFDKLFIKQRIIMTANITKPNHNLIHSYEKEYLRVITLNPIEVKCLACMSDVTYKGKASIIAHTSNNSHQKAKLSIKLQEKNNHL